MVSCSLQGLPSKSQQANALRVCWKLALGRIVAAIERGGPLLVEAPLRHLGVMLGELANLPVSFTHVKPNILTAGARK